MKLNRHAKILELIKNFPITTQEELLQKLKEEGYSVTQSTVSRDIKTLRLQKTHSIDGKYRYSAPTGIQPDVKNGFSGILSGSIVSVETAQNIVVVKTIFQIHFLSRTREIDSLPVNVCTCIIATVRANIYCVHLRFQKRKVNIICIRGYRIVPLRNIDDLQIGFAG